MAQLHVVLVVLVFVLEHVEPHALAIALPHVLDVIIHACLSVADAVDAEIHAESIAIPNVVLIAKMIV